MKKRKRCNHEKFELWEEECFNPGTPLLPRGYRDNKVNLEKKLEKECRSQRRNFVMFPAGQMQSFSTTSFMLTIPTVYLLKEQNMMIW